MNLLKKYYQNRRVLVTGGAGFIGSHIVEKLVASEAQVTVLDNFSTGKVENLRSVLHKIHIIAGDITDIPTCERATLKKTHVFHLAAMVSVPDSIINPDLCFRINTSGTNNILAAAARNSVDHLVFSSSSAVYGKQAGINSEATVTSPQSPYGESKLEGEHLCKEHSQNSGLHTTILRYFNVHGKRQSARGGYAAVVAKFMDNLRNKAPLTIFGNGKQTRDFVHVSEIAHANLLLATLPHKAEIFNIGSGESITLLDLVERLEKETGHAHTKILFEPARAGDIVHSAADCSKYQSIKTQHEE